MKFVLALIFCFALALTFYFSFPVVEQSSGQTTDHNIGLSHSPQSPAPAASSTFCLSEVEVSNEMQELAAPGSQTEFDQARALLIKDFQKSPECRKELVSHIMSTMDKAALDFNTNPDGSSLWREGAGLLGDLKATEALDFLIARLDMTAGVYSRSMRHQPAINGVIKLGLVAVPKLSAALRDSSNPDIKLAAAYCLTTIGLETHDRGSTQNALRQALASETDQCIGQFIRLSMDVLQGESGSKGKSETSDTREYVLGKWNNAFSSGCNR